ncbi:MAG: leucine-rich repeat protein [Eubacterium sp.]
MRNLIKKATAVLLAVLLAISAFPLTAFAGTSGDYSYFEVAKNNGVTYVELSSYNGTSNSITLPTELDGKVVVGTNYNFGPNTANKPTEIIVPEGYNYIGGIRGFKNLSITLPSSVKIICSDAFENTTVESINFPQGLEAIGFSAFEGVTFTDTDIVLPDSLKYISDLAFSSTNITSIHLGKNVNYSRLESFEYGVDIVAVDNTKNMNDVRSFIGKCSSLSEITVDIENPYLTADNNALLSKDKSILWCYPAGLPQRDYTTPDYVKAIASYAFSGAKFNSFTLSNTVTDLYEHSFTLIYADSFTFEDNCGLNEIVNSAFYNSKITSPIEIPNTVEKIGEYAFAYSSITELNWQKNSKCRAIEKHAFQYSKLIKANIPASVNALGDGEESCVFSNCTTLTDVIFEDNSHITVWGKDLFKKCTSLTNIDAGKSNMLQSMKCSFADTAITDLDLSGCYALSSINYLCFWNDTKIVNVNLSNTDLFDLSNTFNGCTNLKNVALPDCLYEIGAKTFYNCTNLETVNTDEVVTVDSTAFTGCKSLLNGVPASKTSQNNGEFYYYEFENSITIGRPKSGYNFKDLIVPQEINGKPVTRIGRSAFSSINAENIILPDTITSVSEYAFSNAVVDNGVSLPDSVTFIGEYAFNCYQETEDSADGELNINTVFEFPDNVKIINANVFYESKITDVKINDGALFIQDYAFYNSDIDHFEIPDSVIHINQYALNTKDLKSVDFGAGMNDIDSFIINSFITDGYYNAKVNANPVEYSVSADNRYFSSADGVIYNKEVTKLIAFPCGKSSDEFVFPDSVNEISGYAFGNNNGSISISIPYTVNIIDDNAFNSTKSLKNVFIPNSVTSIGEYAFSCGEALENIVFDSNMKLPSLKYTFSDCPAIKNVTFGEGSYVEILMYTFCQSGIESINLNCVSRYIEGVFMDSALKDITLCDGIECIEFASFSGTQIESIVIPGTVSKIGGRVFEDCKNLSFVNLSNVQGLDYAAFKNCISLESIDLTGVYYLGGCADDRVFYGCDNLKKFYFTAEEKEAYIAENEFADNETLETVVIGDSITEIQDRAFANCTNLETAYIADGVEEISDTAFENCEKLTIVCLYASPAMYYAQKNDISYQTFVISPIPDQTYTGKAIKPALTVKQGSNTLSLNKDYSASYSNNINVGKAKVVVTGLGDYKIFASTANFNIVAPPHTHSYTSRVTKAPTCASSGVRAYTCSCGKSYTEAISPTGKHTYKTTTKKATVSASGKIETKCTVCGKISSSKTIAKISSVKLSTAKYTYNGKVKTPSVTVKDSKGKTLKKNTDYTVTYAGGRKNVGKYTVKITFKGNYSGTKSLSFVINPKGTGISKLIAKKGGFKLTWKKQATQTTGYQIQYSTSSKFTKATTKTVSKNSTLSKSISWLQKGKKYYVRVRTYKAVGSARYYSAWSSAKYVTTKK